MKMKMKMEKKMKIKMKSVNREADLKHNGTIQYVHRQYQ